MSLEYRGNALIDYSHKLSRIHRAALPNAVRFTLTDVAKDVYFRTLRKNANKQFDVKKQSFFRAFSEYKPASGNNISRMQSTAGMIKKGKSKVSTEIGQQQFAGVVHNKSFIAIEKGRTGKGLTNKKYRDARKRKPIIAEKGKMFFPNAKKAKDTNSPLIVKKNKRGYFVKVTKIRKAKGHKFKREVVTQIIGGYKENRKIDLKTNKPFLNNAALESGNLLNAKFIKNAKLQVKRFLR